MKMKGQVSTEYLVILAVVLVVALVVVYLVGGFAGLGAGTLESQSKSYWGSASPFAINNYKVMGTNVTLEITNQDIEKLTLTDVTVDGVSVSIASTSFASGETKSVSGTLGATCGTAGTMFQYDIVLVYTKGTITGLREVGSTALVGTCS